MVTTRKKIFKQTGKTKSIPRDLARKAKPPGYRKSASGNWYLETRKNRTDKRGLRL